ncbi:hypothetical protein SAMN02745866_00183 [Alteromonadaceae bacterium Bs31]|nr:hypothetical protein SAMN02745866_00183 [Alteromonadaceae bacterium Bs31]
MRIFLLVVLVSILPACWYDDEAKVNEIAIVNAVMPAMPPGQTMASIYFSLENNTSEALVVNHLKAPISDHIEVHRNFYEEGMMKMRSVSHLSIAAGSKLRFEPGGYHLMVFGIAEPLKQGDQFPLTIEFEGGKSATALVEVKSLSL